MKEGERRQESTATGSDTRRLGDEVGANRRIGVLHHVTMQTATTVQILHPLHNSWSTRSREEMKTARDRGRSAMAHQGQAPKHPPPLTLQRSTVMRVRALNPT